MIDCHGEQMLGIVHDAPGSRGLLVVVGGPNYRVGSHRQFLLLARYLADHDVPVMRFDYRGMGDSTGAMRDFESISQDIGCAIDAFQRCLPDIHDVILLGLCDGASAVLAYAPEDPRVTGLVLINPWARDEKTEAKAYIRHYYRGRLLSPKFWKKALSGNLDWRESTRSLTGFLRRLIQRSEASGSGEPELTLSERMANSFAEFRGEVLLVLSGADLTAAEFRDTAGRSRRWRRLLCEPRVSTMEIAGADHTLSRSEWRDSMFARIRSWLTEDVR